MTRTLSTLIAIISLLCLASCDSNNDDYRITWASEPGIYRANSIAPRSVINSKEELDNYLQENQVETKCSIYKELKGNFSDYSIITYADVTVLKPQKIEYTEDSKNITIYCERTNNLMTPYPYCFFIKIKPQIPTNTKVTILINGKDSFYL